MWREFGSAYLGYQSRPAMEPSFGNRRLRSSGLAQPPDWAGIQLHYCPYGWLGGCAESWLCHCPGYLGYGYWWTNRAFAPGSRVGRPGGWPGRLAILLFAF